MVEEEANMGLSASSTTTRIITLTLRILTAVALIVSLVLLAIIQQPMIQYNEQKEIIRTFTMRFYDVVPFRYTAATIVIGVAYSIFQFVCAIVRLAKGNDGNIILDFYGEEVMSKLLASGAVAGFVGSTDMVKNWWDQDRSIKEVIDNFINRTYPAHALVLLAFLFSFVLSVISSYALANRNNN